MWSEVRAVFGFGAGSGEATRLVGVAAHGVPCCLGEVEVVLELGRERSQLLLLHGDACALGLTDAPRLLLESLPQDVRLQTRAQRGAEGETAEGAERGGGGREREGGRWGGGVQSKRAREGGRTQGEALLRLCPQSSRGHGTRQHICKAPSWRVPLSAISATSPDLQCHLCGHLCVCVYLLVAELLHLGAGLRVERLERRGARLQGGARRV